MDLLKRRIKSLGLTKIILGLLIGLSIGGGLIYAGTKWSSYGAMNSGMIATTDDFLVRDVSDTALGETGTQKRYTWDSMRADLTRAYYPDPSEADQGVTGGGNTVKAIVTSIGTSKKATIVFTHTWAATTTTYTFSTSLDLSSYTNITFVVQNGALISPAAGVTVTFYSPANIIAGERQQIFSGDGDISFSIEGVLYPNWFSENTTPGTTDMTTAISKMISAAATGSTCQFMSENYLFTTVTINKALTIRGKGIYGQQAFPFGDAGWGQTAENIKGTILRSTATSGNAITAYLTDVSYPQQINFQDLAVIGPGSGSSIGIHLGDDLQSAAVSGSMWQKVLIGNFYTDLELTAMNHCTFIGLRLGGANYGLRGYDNALTTNYFYGFVVETTSVAAVEMGGSTKPTDNVFIGGLFQNNTGDIIISNGKLTFKNFWFENSSSTGDAIQLNGASYCIFEDLWNLYRPITVNASADTNYFKKIRGNSTTRPTITIVTNAFNNKIEDCIDLVIVDNSTGQTSNALRVGNVIHNTSIVSTGANTSEVDLQKVLIYQKTLGKEGSIYLTAAGRVTGTSNTKTIKLYFGSIVLATISLNASDTGDWGFEAWVDQDNDEAKQKILVKAYFGTTLSVMDYLSATEDSTSNITVKVTGETPDAGDEIYSEILNAEVNY